MTGFRRSPCQRLRFAHDDLPTILLLIELRLNYHFHTPYILTS